MAYYTVPLIATPSQTLDTILGGQPVSIYLQTRRGKLYIDVALDSSLIVQGRLCLNGQKIANEKYRGFKGELFFVDIRGSKDPVFDELGSRFLLVYWDGVDE